MAAVLLRGVGESAAPETAALPLDDFDIVADGDSFEMIRDVEFYAWLAEAGLASSDNSG